MLFLIGAQKRVWNVERTYTASCYSRKWLARHSFSTSLSVYFNSLFLDMTIKECWKYVDWVSKDIRTSWELGTRFYPRTAELSVRNKPKTLVTPRTNIGPSQFARYDISHNPTSYTSLGISSIVCDKSVVNAAFVLSGNMHCEALLNVTQKCLELHISDARGWDRRISLSNNLSR